MGACTHHHEIGFVASYISSSEDYLPFEVRQRELPHRASETATRSQHPGAVHRVRRELCHIPR
jgi:hypothetical protein